VDGPKGDVLFSLNPKDAATLPAETYLVHGLVGGGSVESAQYKLSDSLAPNADGNYVFDASKNLDAFTAANAFAAANNAQALLDEKLGPVADATGVGKVTVNADKGEDLNAYFRPDENSLNFFHYSLPDGTIIKSGAAGDVVGHENGHKDLNNRRPGYFNSFSPSPGAFHESYGDVTAFLEATQDPEVIKKVVDQTGGDLSKTNVASESAKELGVAINKVVGHDVTGGDFIRNADNNFKYADPSTLEDNPADPSQLGSEVHNFSRLWTGAFYDVFKGLVAENIKNGQDPATAIKGASDEGFAMYKRLFGPTGNDTAPKGTAPEGDFTYPDMAKAWIKGEKELGGKHADLVAQVMEDRGILPKGQAIFQSETSTLPAGTRDLTVAINGDVPDAFKGATVTTTLSGSADGIFQDAEAQTKVQSDVTKLIKDGDILVTNGSGVPSEKDLRQKIGDDGSVTHYRGYLAVNPDGTKVIKRTPIFD
jgi:hypothetical protein